MSSSNSEKPTVLIPVNATEQSKSRLSTLLEPHERRELVLSMTRDFFDHLQSCEDRVHYGTVTEGEEVSDLVKQRGGFVLDEPEDAGTLGEIVDGAVCSGGRFADSGGLLVMPVDLPWVDESALRKILGRMTQSSVFLVPDEDEEGTNVLWRKPPGVISCQYEGTSSFEAHYSEAEQQGLSPEVGHPEPFQFDLDTPEDWHRLLQYPDRLSEYTGSFVAEFMIDINRSLSG